MRLGRQACLADEEVMALIREEAVRRLWMRQSDRPVYGGRSESKGLLRPGNARI